MTRDGPLVTVLAAVALGAVLGAWMRWALSYWLNPRIEHLPLGTLTSNLIGGYLRLVVTGPAAQLALATYDDVWNSSEQLDCLLHPVIDTRWQWYCEWKPARVTHPPEVLKYYLPGGSEHAYSIYRTDIYKEADEVYTAVLGSAQETIDAMHVNFALELICDVAVVFPDICTYEDCLALHARLDAGD